MNLKQNLKQNVKDLDQALSDRDQVSYRKSGYFVSGARRFDTIGALLGVCGIFIALSAVTGSVSAKQLLDLGSLVFIALGTCSVILVQYDLKSLYLAWIHLIVSLFSLRLAKLKKISKKLSEAVENGQTISDFSSTGQVTGDVLNDVAFFYENGLCFEEVDEILASALLTEIQLEKRSAEVFFRASQLAPALGLLGTVIGLVGVLKSLGDPSQIGGAMSLALMTTAYGSALGSLVFGPFAGRIDSYSDNLLQVEREIIRKLHILYLRSETDLARIRKLNAA